MLDSQVAERGGFEPPLRFLAVNRFSKPAPSATRPPLQCVTPGNAPIDAVDRGCSSAAGRSVASRRASHKRFCFWRDDPGTSRHCPYGSPLEQRWACIRPTTANPPRTQTNMGLGWNRALHLGRCPRLVWGRAVGPESSGRIAFPAPERGVRGSVKMCPTGSGRTKTNALPAMSPGGR